MSTYAERVALGAALLDAKDPDWLYEVDLEDLTMSSSRWCVAGQMPGGFYAAMERLGLHNGDILDYDRGAAHGFLADPNQGADGIRAEYAGLEVEWRRVITERRAADAAAAATK